jgi:hypothetical protein
MWTAVLYLNPMSLLSVRRKVLTALLGKIVVFLRCLQNVESYLVHSIDPSIRITYHPRVKKMTQSGFYTKTSHHDYSQRITIFNTKTTSVERLKIIDQVPVTEDSQISVKLINPALRVLPNISRNDLAPMVVDEGIVAQWDGADEQDFDKASLGQNGKLNWVCSVPPQAKINLLLRWQVTAPARVTLVGL